MTLPYSTERLVLRRFTAEDTDDLYEFLSDPQVVEFEPYEPMNREQALGALQYRIDSDDFYAVTLQDSGKLIGNVYFGRRDFYSFEIGYVFNKAYQGKGYASEACRAVIAHAFADGAHRIYAECNPLNQPSWRLLERLGFVREAHLRSNVYFKTDDNGLPVWKDTFIYGLLRSDFEH